MNHARRVAGLLAIILALILAFFVVAVTLGFASELSENKFNMLLLAIGSPLGMATAFYYGSSDSTPQRAPQRASDVQPPAPPPANPGSTAA